MRDWHAQRRPQLCCVSGSGQNELHIAYARSVPRGPTSFQSQTTEVDVLIIIKIIRGIWPPARRRAHEAQAAREQAAAEAQRQAEQAERAARGVSKPARGTSKP